MWHQIEHVERLDSGEISAELRIPPESQWFSGHFPGQPILPGIAQLALVRDTVSQACGRSVAVSEFSRIKFKKMITPGKFLRIMAIPKKGPGDAYIFRILIEDEVVCSGNLTLRIDEKNRDQIQ
jgi:3-hydroxymyristoyl/3-hydroxydecanoyl-(acyl carrier protein) dehydratase